MIPLRITGAHGPDPAVLLKVRRALRVPVLRVDDQRTRVDRRGHLVVHEGNDLLRAPDVEAADRVGEVVLDVDDEQGGPRVVIGHPPSMPG
jgi:hypothetical protein